MHTLHSHSPPKLPCVNPPNAHLSQPSLKCTLCTVHRLLTSGITFSFYHLFFTFSLQPGYLTHTHVNRILRCTHSASEVLSMRHQTFNHDYQVPKDKSLNHASSLSLWRSSGLHYLQRSSEKWALAPNVSKCQIIPFLLILAT